MVRRRYRSSVEQEQALRLIAAVPTPDIEKIRVMQAVFVIFCLEHGPPWHPDLRLRHTADLASCYERLMKRHGLPE
jgi:hypothetical protein